MEWFEALAGDIGPLQALVILGLAIAWRMERIDRKEAETRERDTVAMVTKSLHDMAQSIRDLGRRND